MAKVVKVGDKCMVHCTKPGHGWREGTVIATHNVSTLTSIEGAKVVHPGARVQAGDGCFDIGMIYGGSSFVTDEGEILVTTDSTIGWTGIPGSPNTIDSGYFDVNAFEYSHVNHTG